MISRLLVLRPGGMGDLLLTLPALDLLCKAHANAEIQLVAHPSYVVLASRAGFISTVRSYDDAFFTPLFSDCVALPSDLADYLSRFDAALCYIDDPRDTVGCGLSSAGVEKAVFFDPAPPPGGHISQHLADALQPLGVVGEIRCVRLTPTPPSLSRASLFLEESFGDPQMPFVAVHPGAGSGAKKWPAERFADVARALVRERGLAAIFITGPAEADAPREFKGLASDIPAAVVTNPGVDTLAALISLASVYLGNDSGPTHLAAALGVPVIALFGPTDPSVWRPLGNNVRVLQSPSDCSPCDRQTRTQCGRNICMEEIALDSVLAVARSCL